MIDAIEELFQRMRELNELAHLRFMGINEDGSERWEPEDGYTWEDCLKNLETLQTQTGGKLANIKILVDEKRKLE